MRLLVTPHMTHHDELIRIQTDKIILQSEKQLEDLLVWRLRATGIDQLNAVRTGNISRLIAGVLQDNNNRKLDQRSKVLRPNM